MFYVIPKTIHQRRKHRQQCIRNIENVYVQTNDDKPRDTLVYQYTFIFFPTKKTKYVHQ